MQGYVHSFESFGTVDGDGIRFVLFLSGCHLGCKFCHNPDSWDKRCGKQMTVEQVLEKVEDYRPYFEATGGGLTISGGDPLVQPDFVASLLAAARLRGIHTCLETSGYGDREAFARLVPLADMVIYGLKGFSDKVYRYLTAHGNDRILANLSFLGHHKSSARLRYLVIPTVNDTPEEAQKLALFLHRIPCGFEVELIPYHTMGIPKWEAMGRDYQLDHLRPPTADEIAEFGRFLQDQGLKVLGLDDKYPDPPKELSA